MEFDRTKQGWLLIACLLINGPPSAANLLENIVVHDDYRAQIMDWYCMIRGVGHDPGHGWPDEAHDWANYYMAWYRNTKQEKDNV